MTQDECFLGVDELDPDDIHAYLDQVEGETDPDETRHQESAVGRRAVMLLGLLLEEGLHMWSHVEAEVMRIVGAAGALGLYDLRLPMSLQIGQLADSDLSRELEDLGLNTEDLQS